MLPIEAFIDRPLVFLVDFGLSRNQIVDVLKLKASKAGCLKAHRSALNQSRNCADLYDFVEVYYIEIRKNSDSLVFCLAYGGAK